MSTLGEGIRQGKNLLPLVIRHHEYIRKVAKGKLPEGQWGELRKKVLTRGPKFPWDARRLAGPQKGLLKREVGKEKWE